MKVDITDAFENLKKGNVILCPTDTVWGLSCDATNNSAVQEIIKIKQRSEDKSFIILVSSLDMLGRYVHSFPNFAVDLIEMTSEPLTIIFPRGEKLSKFVINSDESVAIRLIKSNSEESKFCFDLIRKFNKPIVSTSANISGMPAPKKYSEIDSLVVSQVAYAVPYFTTSKSQRSPSKIIKLNEDNTFKIIR